MAVVNVKHLRDPLFLEYGTALPAILSCECPQCKKVIEIDLRTYDGCLEFNTPIKFHFKHSEGNCKFEWHAHHIIRLAILPAQPAVYKSWTSPDTKVKVIKALRDATKIGLMDAKKWSETGPHAITRELALKLEEAGAYIEWRY